MMMMMMMREYSFGEIWIRIVDARSPGPCCIKGLDESIIRMYSLVPLMHCDMIWPLILIQFTPKECTIKAGLHRQFLSRWSCNFAGVNQVQFSVWFVAAISQRFWTWLKLDTTKITFSCHDKNHLCKQARPLPPLLPSRPTSLSLQGLPRTFITFILHTEKTHCEITFFNKVRPRSSSKLTVALVVFTLFLRHSGLLAEAFSSA